MRPVDVLVIDEAGQLALADAVAASGSARNVILLGDPLQLAQVSIAVHPDGAGASVLSRAHPRMEPPPSLRTAACSWPRDPTDAPGGVPVRIRSVLRRSPVQPRMAAAPGHRGCRPRAGVGRGPHHQDRSTWSPEEAGLEVADAILGLLGRRWTNAEGEQSLLTAGDFMVVAPYERSGSTWYVR